MAKHLVSMMILTVSSIGMLTGCDNSTDKTNTASEPAVPSEQSESTDSATNPTAKDIDWKVIASTEKAANRADYNYPFALDSQNVRDYADYFKVDNATAQHNLTVSMASNEALSKVLDQLDSSYTSHELTDGENIELIIHTTSDIKASSYDYVFEEDFAKGLILPIVIKPDGKKSDLKPHGGLEE